MDQIRTALAWLKKHHFWVLSVIVVLVSIVTWYSAASDLSKRYETSKQEIDSEFSTQENLTRQAFHPNEVINTEQQKQNALQAEEVAELWKNLYEAQQEAVLKWPDALPSRFHRAIAKLKFGDEIHENLRNDYLNYAKRHFPELPKIVKALELPNDSRYGGGMSGRGGDSAFSFNLEQFEQSLAEGQLQGFRGRDGGGENEQPQMMDFLVYWQDQNKIRDQLAFPTKPSSLKIWVTQEDLWVYTTLLQIIAKTNGAANATRFSNAAIRVIDSLDVGKLAAQSSRGKGRILMREQTMVGGRGLERGMEEGYGGGRESGYGADMEYMDRGGEGYGDFGMGRDGMDGGGDEAPVLLSMRYLDETGQPKPVAGSYTPGDFGVEYKRLPVRMALYMDQRWLYYLISACANAPLQVEVQEVRINPLEGQGFGRGSRSQRMYDFQSAGRGTFSGGREGGGRGDMLSTSLNMFDRRPYLVPVIIQGIIYIFNEPDLQSLQTSGGEA